jgi:flagellar biosynthesis protein FliP
MGMKIPMKNRRWILQVLVILIIVLVAVTSAYAVETTTPITATAGTNNTVTIGLGNSAKDTTTNIQILLILTVLSIAPSILIMMTSFTRIIIILSFLRNALGTQQMPPNQVLIGLALFLSLFIMSPVITQLNNEAYQPLSKGTIKSDVAIDKAGSIMKTFMLKQFRKGNEKDLELFVNLAKIKKPVKPEDLPLTVVIPAFMINELTIAFKFGFLIFIPFLIIDMVVASTLMSMGMMMLPPVMISLPFKILLFVMVDGWGLIVQSIVGGFVH